MRLSTGLGLAIVLAAAGCSLPRESFACDAWSDCGPGGVCEPGTQSCSVPDPSCPTGARFSDLSAEPYAGACVEALPDAGPGAACVESTTCARFRACIDHRCVSTHALAAGGNFWVARCALEPSQQTPLYLWGEQLIIPPFAPIHIALPVYNCPPLLGGALSCPSECVPCATDPCTVPFCLGSDTTLELAVGTSHYCFTNGRTFCAGDNASYQLGSAAPVTQIGPVEQPVIHELLAAGESHTCGSPGLSDQVHCWGKSDDGQLDGVATPGRTDVARVTVPFPPDPTLRNVDFLAASRTFTCAASDDEVSCWGTRAWAAGPAAALIADLGAGQITDLDAGVDHACVVKGGRAVCWGNNEHGQVAPASPAMIAPATDVLGLTSVERVVAGRAHSCAVTTDGAVWCWGATDVEQLGTGAVGPGPVQVLPLAPSAVGPIAAGDDTTCAIYADDRMRCWGDVLQLDSVRYDDTDVVCLFPPPPP